MLRRGPVLIALLVLLPVVLFAGLWLGGHPSWLPGPVRDVVVADSQGRVYEEAIELIEDDYYRKVDGDRLLDTSLEEAVKSLDDRFSAYFTPEAYADFKESTAGKFEGIGVTIDPDERQRGLVVLRVFEGSPAERAGLRAGDVIVAAGGTSLQGASTKEGSAKIHGRPGTSVELTWLTGERRITKRVERERVDIPVVESAMERADGTEVAHVRLASFTSGAHGEVGAAVRRLIKQGAKGVVLDLRDNGGGLLNEAVLVSSIFIPEGPIVSTKGRTRPEKTYEATGGAISPKIPVVVLVDRESASASEIVAGALQDRDRGEGDRHAHLRQGRLPGGQAALQRRRAGHHRRRVLHAGRAQPRRRRRQGGQGRRARRPRGRRRSQTKRRDEALESAVDEVAREAGGDVSSRPGRERRRARGRASWRSAGASSRRRRSSPAGGADEPRQAAAAARRAAGRPRARRADRAARGHARVLRRIGRADVARDVIEALMLDRGLRRRFDPAVERTAARGGRAAAARRPRRPARPARVADLHDRPADRARLRRRDLRRGARRTGSCASGCTSPTSPPTSPRARSSTARPTGAATSVYVPGAVEPMLPEALSNRACSLVPGEDRLAVTVELDLEGARVRRSAFHRSLIRSDARLDYPQVDRDLRRPRARRGAVGRAAGRRPRAPPRRSTPPARSAARWPWSPSSRSSTSRATGHVTALGRSEQTESHRVIEHLMIAANEAVATLLGDAQAAGALPHPRAAGARPRGASWSSSSSRSTCRRRPCPTR